MLAQKEVIPEMVSPFMIFWMRYGDLPSTKIEELKRKFPDSKYQIAVLGGHLFFRVRSTDTERFVVEATAIGLEPGEAMLGGKFIQTGENDFTYHPCLPLIVTNCQTNETKYIWSTEKE